jgi:hypothetical protein
MDKSYTYHKDEVVHSTVEAIVDFFINNPRSDKMKFTAKAMKLLYQYHNSPEETANFYIGSQSHHGTTAEISGGDYLGDGSECSYRKYVIDTIPIIFIVVDGKEIVLFDIIEYPGKSDHPEDYHVSIKHSKHSRDILKRLRASEKAVDKYNL